MWGGAFNPRYWDHRQRELVSNVRMTMLHEPSVGGEAKEVITFTFQAIDAVMGRPLVVLQRVEIRSLTILGKSHWDGVIGS